MSRVFLAVPAVALCLPLAPATPIPEGAKEPPLYWPTAVGTKLIYDRDGEDETWVVTAVERQGRGGKIVTTGCELASGGRTPHQKRLATATGIELLAEEGYAYDPPWPTLKLPPGSDKTWDVLTHRAGGNLVIGKMGVGNLESVTVPAGTFQAVRVACKRGDIDAWPYYWYAQKVGIVKLASHKMNMVIKSFSPGKD